MKISIIGCGYVGAITGTCLADMGNEIIFAEPNEIKVKSINAAKSPIFEPGLEELILKNKERILATIDSQEALENSKIIFICVGTPSDHDGSIYMNYIKSASRDAGRALKDRDDFPLIVVKSTVLPGTTEGIVKSLIENESKKTAFKDFGLASNPEFLREGEAIKDFFEPDRIVVGVEEEQSRTMLERLYSDFDCPQFFTNIKTAETIKYASNAFLATKISFANEIGNLCKALGIDSYNVFKGVGMDQRINPHFFRSGIGFGGSCFSKDVRALVTKINEIGIDPKILKSVLEVNEDQPLRLVELLEKHIGNLKNRRIGVLGLAFKPNTDDARESRAAITVRRLIAKGAEVVAYDPMAMNNFKEMYPSIDIAYTRFPEDVLDSEAILILTEWKEFQDLDYSGKIVIDGRRIDKARQEAAIYEGVCW